MEVKTKRHFLTKQEEDYFISLEKAKELLKESVEMLNLIPNRKYCENYKLCSRIDKFLKEN